MMTYFLRKKGIVRSGSPLVHYILGLIIGHIVYVVIALWAIATCDLIICLR